MDHHDVDIQWGNHDVVWMGAAAGSAVCVFTVLKTSLAYGNLDLIETGYGISLRALTLCHALLRRAHRPPVDSPMPDERENI